MFYMNMKAFNEGEQADAYKKRKEEEERQKEKENEERAKRRYNNDDESRTFREPGRKMTPQNPNYGIMHPIKTIKGNKADKKLENDIHKKVNTPVKYDEKGNAIEWKNKPEYHIYGKTKYDVMDASDALNRHFRRHPEKLKEDCGIFESVEFI